MSYTFQRSCYRFLWFSGAILLGLLVAAQTAFAGDVSFQNDTTFRINDSGGTARDVAVKASSLAQYVTVNDNNIQFNLVSGNSVVIEQTEGRMFDTSNTAITNKCINETLSQVSFTTTGTTTVSLSVSKCAPTGGGGGGTESTPSPAPAPSPVPSSGSSSAPAPSPAPSTTPAPAPSPAPATTPAPSPAPALVVIPPPVSVVFKGGLGIGMTNADVKRLQTLLATDPTIYPEGLTSGYFGSLTKAAVGRFQMKYDIVSSASDQGYGYVGPMTRAKLQEVYEGGVAAVMPSAPAEVPAPSAVGVSAVFITPLDMGMTNADVKRLQTLLATDSAIYPEGLTSGYFGSLTKAAVGRFQMKYGLVNSSSDAGYGFVGPKTRTKLQEIYGGAVAPASTPPATSASSDDATVNSLKAQIDALQKMLDQLKAQ